MTEYFARYPLGTGGLPKVRQVYIAGEGWRTWADRHPLCKGLPTRSRLRQLQREGVTLVGLGDRFRCADFNVAELLKRRPRQTQEA